MHKLFKIRKLMDNRGGMLKNYNKKEIKNLNKIDFIMRENLFSLYKKKMLFEVFTCSKVNLLRLNLLLYYMEK